MGGRRFCLTIGCAILYTVLLLFDKLDSGAYVALQIATVGAYLAANTHQKYTDAKYSNDNQSDY